MQGDHVSGDRQFRRSSCPEVRASNVDLKGIRCVLCRQLDIDTAVGAKVGGNTRQGEAAIAAGASDADSRNGRWVDDLRIIKTERQFSRSNRANNPVLDQLAVVGLNADECWANRGLCIGFHLQTVHLRLASVPGKHSQVVRSGGQARAVDDFWNTGRIEVRRGDHFSVEAFDLEGQVSIDQGVLGRQRTPFGLHLILLAGWDHRDPTNASSTHGQQVNVGVFAFVDRKIIELLNAITDQPKVGRLAIAVVVLEIVAVERLGRDDVVELGTVISQRNERLHQLGLVGRQDVAESDAVAGFVHHHVDKCPILTVGTIGVLAVEIVVGIKDDVPVDTIVATTVRRERVGEDTAVAVHCQTTNANVAANAHDTSVVSARWCSVILRFVNEIQTAVCSPVVISSFDEIEPRSRRDRTSGATVNSVHEGDEVARTKVSIGRVVNLGSVRNDTPSDGCGVTIVGTRTTRWVHPTIAQQIDLIATATQLLLGEVLDAVLDLVHVVRVGARRKDGPCHDFAAFQLLAKE